MRGTNARETQTGGARPFFRAIWATAGVNISSTVVEVFFTVLHVAYVLHYVVCILCTKYNACEKKCIGFVYRIIVHFSFILFMSQCLFDCCPTIPRHDCIPHLCAFFIMYFFNEKCVCVSGAFFLLSYA